MSANGVLFHGFANASQLSREPSARSMDADPRGVPRAAKDLRDLGRVEPFPGEQRKKLALVRPQTGERGRDGLQARIF
jgi:hypothetical protein